MEKNTFNEHTLDGGSIPPGVTAKSITDRELRRKNGGLFRNTVANFRKGGLK